jgi:hypothetical protein
MANMSVSEKDFEVLASATLAAEARGDMVEATNLDKLARKASAALTVSKSRRERGIVRMVDARGPSNFTWESVPSLLGTTSR